MKTDRIQDVVYDMAVPVVESKGMELVGVEYVKEGGNWYLRLYIDKDGGVDLDDCQAVSQQVSDLLDEKDPIPQAYFLEVSSPGIERVLQREKDFLRFEGEQINVHTYTPVEGKKTLQGRLGPVNETTLILNREDRQMAIPRNAIAQVRLAWREEGGKKSK